MDDPATHDRDSRVRSKWLKFGVAIAVAQYAFLALLLILLRIDFHVAVTTALIVSVLGAIAITAYALYGIP